MPWNYNDYQGIDPNLLRDLVNKPSPKAQGLSALTQGIFGQQNQNSGVNGAISQIPQIMQQQKMKQLIQQLTSGQKQGSSPQQGAGIPNPFMQSIGKNTTMDQDPLGLFGGQ